MTQKLNPWNCHFGLSLSLNCRAKRCSTRHLKQDNAQKSACVARKWKHFMFTCLDARFESEQKSNYDKYNLKKKFFSAAMTKLIHLNFWSVTKSKKSFHVKMQLTAIKNRFFNCHAANSGSVGSVWPQLTGSAVIRDLRFTTHWSQVAKSKLWDNCYRTRVQ